MPVLDRVVPSVEDESFQLLGSDESILGFGDLSDDERKNREAQVMIH